jgi:signal transduction histidine kinase/CheY-like chemotaxis protein
MELFYHKAHLQNLRADFRDLDQHLASRHETVRLLAKLPEPGAILGDADDPEQVDLARARYTQWINQILQDQLDIIQILFLGDAGRERFWLERDPETQQWRPTTRIPDRPPEDFVRAAARVDAGGVLVSRIRLNPRLGARDPRRLMNLYLISPIPGQSKGRAGPIGSVAISIDVGGMAEFYRNTLWVNDSGSYLEPSGFDEDRGRAFRDFPGLEDIFARGTLDLWKGPHGQQVLWVPMFLTENSGPLWVGRQVDPSPLAAFRNALVFRVMIIVLALVAVVLIMARWIAVRVERFGQDLTRGIDLMLKQDEAVTFNLAGPHEVETLGRHLTALALTHAEHARALRDHARELEESNRYKSEFLANVSHELRTPLNSILLLSKLLADPSAGLGPDQAKQARVIHQAGRDLQGLINNILDHSKIEARETILHLEWLAPRDVVGGLMELVAPQFEEKGLYLTLEVGADAPQRIRSDPEKLRQILKNFLANAVKFTDQGGVRIRLEGSGEDSWALAIRVSDTGIGIPESKQETVFEAFKQADGSTSRRYGGTGLGLTISRELAKLLGGAIRLESAEGIGSTFTLLLPLEPEATDAPGAPPAGSQGVRASTPALPPAAPRAAFAGERVLLVERDVAALLRLTPMLESLGLRVSAAADAEETLETLREDAPFSLVLVDVDAPEHKGCDIIRAIRADPDLGKMPVVAMSGGEGSGAGSSLEAGADEVLTGPLDPARLGGVLKTVLPHDAARETA